MGTVNDLFPHLKDDTMRGLLEKLEGNGAICVVTPKDLDYLKLKEAQRIMSPSTPKEYEETYLKKPFLATTENLVYIDKLIENVSRAFTILGSGDPVFQLAYKGVKDITALEISEPQIDVFRFRRATILALDYEECYDMLFDTTGRNFLNYEIFKSRIMPYFEKDEETTAKFWEKMFRSYEPEELIAKFFKGGIERANIHVVKESLNYMKKKRNYERLKNNLKEAKINVYCKDAVDFLNKDVSKYDWIDISNILLYDFQCRVGENLEKFVKRLENLKKIKERNLNEKGTFVMDYMFGVNILRPNEAEEESEKKILEIYKRTFENLHRLFGDKLYIREIRSLTKAMPTKGVVDSVIFTRKE